MQELPDFILNSIPQELQIDVKALQAAHNDESVTSIRTNPRKPFHVAEEARPVPWCSNGYYLSHRPNFTADPRLHAGCFYVQEASSMFLAEALGQWLPEQAGLRVVDLCASPGGKSTLSVAALPEDALLLSNEVIKTRLNPLIENAVKWGYDNHWISQNDARDFGKLEGFFDVMLVDAPCSGSGLFRKMPDYAQQIKAEDISHCALRQQRILEDALPGLAQDGLLIYMTCSFSAQENEDVLDWLCAKHDLEPLALEIPDAWGVVETKSKEAGAQGYRFFPHLVEGEGFFLAGFKKRDGFPRKEISYRANSLKNIPSFNHWVSLQGCHIVLHNDLYFLLQEEHQGILHELQKHLKLLKKGILLGKYAGKDFLPDHELALYTKLEKSVPTRVVSREEAIAYLKKELPELPDTPLGWVLLSYEGAPLGWIKNLGKRVNNYYPSTYRIINKNIV